MRFRNKYIILSLLILIICSCDEQEIPLIDTDAAIEAIMEQKGIPSVVACLVDTADILWSASYGFANVEYDIPANTQTFYSLQSITKVILSITVFQLWEKEQIEIDADINSYLPFNVRNPHYPDSPITVHMLLNHTSGIAWPEASDEIPDFDHFYIEEEPTPISVWLPEYILPEGEQYRSSVWKDFPPGEKFLYSNIATSLLALIVEEICNLDYRDYCRENILDPLGMAQSSFYLAELDYNHIATPYYEAGSPMWYFSERHYPAGFLNTNLPDFSRFAMACLKKGGYPGGRILQASTFDKMIEIQNWISGCANLWDHYLGGSIGHIGGGSGWSTSLVLNLEIGSAYFIFSNTENNSVYPGGEINDLVRQKQLSLLND